MEGLIIALSLVGALIAFILVLVIRAIRFKPRCVSNASSGQIEVDVEKATNDLAEMVRIKTVSHTDHTLDDEGEFSKFKTLLQKLFPNIYEKCEYSEPSSRSLLFKLKGESSDAPTVLMAHYDVVSVEEDKWTKPPFDGIIEDGVLWGRGTLDTKGTLNGAMQALEAKLKAGFIPKQDLYLAFAGDEEVNGYGASSIVKLFEEQGINPSLVLDEGGAVVEKVFPGVKKPCAVIGIAEKGIMNVEFVCESNGGHSSAPKPHTPVGKLSRACVRVESKPFKAKMCKATLALFDTVARHSTFVYRLIFANLFVFKPVLDTLGKKSGGEMNALMRTTCAFTQMKGSLGVNVIPPSASMVANLRIIPGDSCDSAIEYLKKTVNDKDIKINMLFGNNPSVISELDCDGYKRVESAVAATWTDAIVSPYLMVACSDSRHWGRISDKVYRFSAMALSNEERATIHGNDERIPIDTIRKTVEFYTRILENC